MAGRPRGPLLWLPALPRETRSGGHFFIGSTCIVAPSETFLRGSQRTDGIGVCAFDTIYPGWYSSRTKHIHLTVGVGDRLAVTQLYFPDELTDQVFARSPYAGRPPRDTVNATDSILVDGGQRTMLHLIGDMAEGLTGLLCLAVGLHSAPSGLTR